MSADGTARAAVLFDVDGTLVDTTYLHTLAWVRALRDAGHDVAMATVHRLIGRSGDDLVDAVVGEPRPDIVDSQAECYAELHDEVRAFPCAADLLRAVGDLGLAVALASSARPADHEVNRRVLGADDAVDGSLDADAVDATKPAPDPFLDAAARVGAEPSRCVVVGDSVWDVLAAGRAGMTPIGLECGGVSAAELTEAGAAVVYRDPAHLLEDLGSSPIGRLAAPGRGAEDLAADDVPAAGAVDGGDEVDDLPEPAEPG